MELLDGVDFVGHVRGTALRDEVPRDAWLQRLTDSLSQLVRAVSALHSAGKLHRDIKPSNVRVTASGRLVLLDFGLAVAIAGADARGDGDGSAAGTPEYMAPEQLWGKPLSPASDWYAVGEVLYEALTGVPAFRGSLHDLVDAKSRLQVCPPIQRASDYPPALDVLVLALLQPDVSKRASQEDVVRTLREFGIPYAAEDEVAFFPREPFFFGREAELSALRAAFHQRTGGAPVLVRIEGPSGMGKTELLRRFATEIASTDDALVLSGRCHPQESVPYKSFDGLVDALGRALAELPRELAAAVAPRNPGALLRVFPALAAVAALAGASAVEQPIEPQELRRRGFEALGELLSAIARERPLALWIDDLQWGDADSILLLRELLLGAAGPMLFLVGYRNDDFEGSPLLLDLERLATSLPVASSCHIRLTPLGEEPSRALAASILGLGTVGSHALIASVAAEALGSPFFITELARHAARSPSGGPSPAAGGGRLAHVLQDRIERLRPGERSLLEIVSTAGGTLNRSIALAAAGLGESGRPHVARLGQACLLRTGQSGGRATVETYHDRIREALLSVVPLERRRQCHSALAAALRAGADADPEAVFRHHLGAGEDREAALFAVPAAERAASALAFERAAELYGQALELGVASPARSALYERRAEALVNHGRGGEAAPCFLAAASALQAEAGHDGDHVFALRTRAAEQFLRRGHNDEGMELMRAVLADVGASIPASPRRALLSALIGRVRLLARGLAFERRSADKMGGKAARRLDALWAATTSFSMMHHIYADALGVEHLRHALKVGDRSRVARALGYEATCCAGVGGPFFRERSRKILAVVKELAEETNNPYDRAWVRMAEGTSAWLGARWADAARLCNEAAAIYREQARGVAWELATAELYTFSALALLGDVGELAVRLPLALRAAEEKDDVYALNSCRLGQHAIFWLAQNRPERCYELAAQAKSTWPEHGFHNQRYQHLIATTQADLYVGDPWAAWARVNDAWPNLEAGQFLRLQCPRVELRHLRARAALGAAATPRQDGAPRSLGSRNRAWSADLLLREAEREAQRIAKDDIPTAAPFAAMIRAGVASIRGDDAAKATNLTSAVEGFARADMRLYAGVARLALLGRHAAGGGLDPPRDTAVPIPLEGVQDPSRFAAALAPGLILA